MDLSRVFRHLLYPGFLVRRRFPAAALKRIEKAIGASESRHRGQIRYALEGALALHPLLAGQTARERAIEVFSALKIWDTEENNGVLVYLLLPDHDVEIIADRGIARAVGPAAWEEICRHMEECFRAGGYERGVVEGIELVGRHLERHYPALHERRDELPDAPIRL
jgi:uncharacterized membrane protein